MMTTTTRGSRSEYTLGGIGLTNAANQLQVFAGFYDGSIRFLGRSYAGIGSRFWYGGGMATTTMGTMRIERTSGMVTITVDGAAVLSGTVNVDLQHLVIYSVRFRDPMGVPADFGTVRFDRVSLCW